ncbi:MAG: hypothetical protein LBU51_01830 [Bacteroidales bacterium]|jgi:hypothetical protein|nr:hypothetical protein [Bacteroidales bacterium]
MTKKKNNTTTETGNSNDGEKQNKLTVEIVSNRSLLEILDDRGRVWKIIAVLLVLVVTIVVALVSFTISIKRIYPYNDIKVNAFGATTMQREDVDIIYWLFNTAELWANSGIKVKKGDILTIRASGRSHTAIHHLVEDARDNKKLRDNWVGTDGEGKKLTGRDTLRADYRIFKSKPQDALLMQVIPQEVDTVDSIVRDSYRLFEYLPEFSEDDAKKNAEIARIKNNMQKRENYYYIGKERQDLLIHKDGILHFAVNDIVLTDSVIKKMISENQKRTKAYIKAHPNSTWQAANEENFKFGKHPDNDTILENANEITYYLGNHYYNAWFDDNVGSFLIVIERQKGK